MSRVEVFDCHTHPTFSSSIFSDVVKTNGIDYSETGLLNEMKRNNVVGCVAIGFDIFSNKEVADLAEKNKNVLPVYGIMAERLEACYANLRKNAGSGLFKGIKIYLGYEPLYPFSKKLDRFYKIAEDNNMVVIFHTGDTWHSLKKSKNGSMLKYSRPLNIDEVAVAHSEMKIIIAHAGNPWIEDTAEIVYKNNNCYADISGWFIGSLNKDTIDIMKDKLKFLVRFGGKEKILFGSDWPIARMDDYIKMVSSCGLSSDEKKNLLYENARKLFRI